MERRSDSTRSTIVPSASDLETLQEDSLKGAIFEAIRRGDCFVFVHRYEASVVKTVVAGLELKGWLTRKWEFRFLSTEPGWLVLEWAKEPWIEDREGA